MSSSTAPRSALNDELVVGLREAFASAAADADVRCVVVRGAGAMFSSGMDLHAQRIGLVNRVASADELDAATDTLVGELLACAPIAVGHAKRILDAAAKPALATTLELDVTVQDLCAHSEDFAEGTRAFFEKRQPSFSGR